MFLRNTILNNIDKNFSLKKMYYIYRTSWDFAELSFKSFVSSGLTFKTCELLWRTLRFSFGISQHTNSSGLEVSSRNSQGNWRFKISLESRLNMHTKVCIRERFVSCPFWRFTALNFQLRRCYFYAVDSWHTDTFYTQKRNKKPTLFVCTNIMKTVT